MELPKLEPLPTKSGELKCDGCTSCCKNELLFLHPDMGDRPHEYAIKAVINPLNNQPGFALQQKPNGDCFYLDAEGCTIYERRPAICKAFDCRKFFLSLGGRNERRAMLKTGALSKDVLDAGRKRLSTLR